MMRPGLLLSPALRGRNRCTGIQTQAVWFPCFFAFGCPSVAKQSEEELTTRSSGLCQGPVWFWFFLFSGSQQEVLAQFSQVCRNLLNKQASRKGRHSHDKWSQKCRLFLGSRKIQHSPDKRTLVGLPALDIMTPWQAGSLDACVRLYLSVDPSTPFTLTLYRAKNLQVLISFPKSLSFLKDIVLTSQPQDSRLLGGFVSQCQLIHCIPGLSIHLLWVCLV